MFLFILGVVVLLVGIGFILFGLYTREEGHGPLYLGFGVTAFALVLMLVTCVRIIPATEVGVPTTMGKVGDPMKSGPHLVLPWTKVSTFRTKFDVMSLSGSEGDFKAVEVVGSEGGQMYLDVDVRYSVLFEGEGCSVTELFRRVRSQSQLERLIVNNETRRAIIDAFVDTSAVEGYTDARAANMARAQGNLTKALGESCVRLDSLILRGITTSPQVQQSIDNAIVAQQNIDKAKADATAAREAAEGRRQAAELDAQANELLQESLTPEVLQARWIEAIRTSQNRIVITDGSTDVLVNSGA